MTPVQRTFKQQIGEDQVDFGFERVSADEKPKRVRHVFEKVSKRYDLMNDLMSFGVHRLWKDSFIDQLNPRPGKSYLDVAGGTGDISFRIQKRLAHRQSQISPESHIQICDINEAMIREGRHRSENERLDNIRLEWVCGDAEHLPIPDRSIDYFTIAFGIRNVTHIDQVLEEAYRVLRPGGRFMCLEFSDVDIPVIEKIYQAYSFHLLPHIGQVVAGDRAPYDYLVESIEKFPSSDRFWGLIDKAGFERSSVRKLSGGVVAIHSGWRI